MTLARAIVLFVALEHVWILILEMFLWTRPMGRKVFGTTPAQAATTRILAANQGLYNGILAAGLIWSLMISDPSHQSDVQKFFLAGVAVAGAYGGWTVNHRIFLVQGVPALIGLGLLFAR